MGSIDRYGYIVARVMLAAIFLLTGYDKLVDVEDAAGVKVTVVADRGFADCKLFYALISSKVIALCVGQMNRLSFKGHIRRRRQPDGKRLCRTDHWTFQVTEAAGGAVTHSAPKR